MLTRTVEDVKPKNKRKSSDTRKEKSKYAARNRRSQESEFFTQIGDTLPISEQSLAELDKSSVMRLGINLLKIRNLIDALKVNDANAIKDEFSAQAFREIDALNGFFIILSKEGDIIYISEDADKYLGISQLDLMGQSIFEYAHPCDHNDIKQTIDIKNYSDAIPASLFVRMKCTLTNRGRSVNLKSASYKVIHMFGHLVSYFDTNRAMNQSFLLAFAELIDHPNRIERPLFGNAFISRHSLDMKFTHVDERLEKILGFESKELIGKSFYNLLHGSDLARLDPFLKSLYSKGQCESDYYRFLSKTGGHIWLLTQATVITDNASHPQCVGCVHHVISEIENRNEITSELQNVSLENDAFVCEFNDLLKQAIQELSPTEISHISSTLSVLEPIEPIPKPFVSSTESVLEPISPVAKPFVSSTESVLEPIIPVAKQFVSSTLSVLEPIKPVQKPFVSSTESVLEPINSVKKPFVSSTESVLEPIDAISKRSKAIEAIKKGLLFDTQSTVDPKTSGMDSSFLVFTDPNGELMLDDEEEDLTHLAPQAGDVCVPLDTLSDDELNQLNFFDEMFREDVPTLVTHDEICNLMPDKSVGKPQDNAMNGLLSKGTDVANDADEVAVQSPFSDDVYLQFNAMSSPLSSDSSDIFNSHESTSSSTHTPSPVLSQTSDYFCKSSEPISKFTEYNDDFLSDKELDSDDLSMRAPYIPMDDDDLFLLSNDDFSFSEIDEFINFDSTANKQIDFDSPLNTPSPDENKNKTQNCGYLAMLLQNDMKDNSKALSLNRNFNQNANKFVSNINSNLNAYTHRLDKYPNNINNNASNIGVNNVCANFNPYCDKLEVNPTKSIDIERSRTSRTLNKRSYPSDPPYGMGMSAPKVGRPSKAAQKSQMQKRIKMSDLSQSVNDKGNSVLLNLLINGEDVTNGYSKYSSVEKGVQSLNITNDFHHNSNYKRSHKTSVLSDGIDMR